MLHICIHIYITHSMCLNETNISEILEAVYKRKIKSSEDCNEVSILVMKQIFTEIVQPLSYICKKSFHSGIFPKDIKAAKVLPIFKIW